jgi:hypothetical protein
VHEEEQVRGASSQDPAHRHLVGSGKDDRVVSWSSRREWCSKAGGPDVNSATAGLMIVGLFPQNDEGRHHDGRGAKDDRCPTRRQAAGRRARRRAARERGLDGPRADGGRRQRPDRRRARRTQPGADYPPQRVSAQGLGHQGGQRRAGHPQAPPRQLLPLVLGAPPPCRAGVGRGRPGGLRQRGVDPQGGPAGRGRWACTG